MQFEWDRRKAQSNARKHGVTFEQAAVVFGDPHASIFPDPDHSAGEDREIIVGKCENRLLLVSFTERREIIRIISARRATSRERYRHEETHT